MHAYLRAFALTTLLITAAAALFNAVVDPFEMFRLIEIPGINAAKYGDGSRQLKGLALRIPRYEAVILGRSRAEVGLRPDHEGFRGMPTYNAALSGADAYETMFVVEHLLRTQPLKLLVINIDADMFLEPPHVRAGFSRSDFDSRHGDSPHLGHLVLSVAALSQSLRTVRGNLSAEPPDYRLGWRAGYERAKGAGRYFAKWALVPKKLTPAATLRRNLARSLPYLRRALQACDARGIDVRLFISPLHPVFQESAYAGEILSLVDEWKAAVVDITSDPALRREVPVYDFSGYEGLVAEAVPSPKLDSARMRWFKDPTHYSTALGDLVLDRVLGYEDANRPRPPGFGVRLTRNNLAAQARDLRLQRERYLQTRGDELAMLQQYALEHRIQMKVTKNGLAIRRL